VVTGLFWTAERDAELQRRVANHEPYKAIAKAMGVTKNAALGRANRLGLTNPRQPAASEAPARGIEFPPHGRCLWIHGHVDAGGGVAFCGDKVHAPGAPWCEPHRQRAIARTVSAAKLL
jgi:GcrA cell cycle regulator